MSSIEPVVALPGRRPVVESARRSAVRFAATIAVVTGGIGSWQLYRGTSPRSGYAMVAFAAAILAYSVVHPAGALALRKAWLWFGSTLGRVNSAILLSVAYVFVLTPLSLLMRLFGRKSFAMEKGRSYFTPREEQRDAKHFEHPY